MRIITRLRLPTTPIVLAVLLAFFFCVYGSYYQGISVFTSPDETANYFFATQFADSGSLAVADDINADSNGIVHPRSVKLNAHGEMVPGSFVGMPLYYGIIATAVGYWSIRWLTPLAAVLGALAFYFIVRRIFGKLTAVVSIACLLILPPYWYYASRGMFHNVLFISLILICVSFLLRAFDGEARKNTKFFILSGVVLGMALSVRLSEIIWVGFLLLAVALWHRKELTFKRAVLFIVSAVCAWMPMLFINQALYGSALTFSYSLPSLGETAPETGTAIEKTSSWVQYFFPFGINSGQSLRMAYTYLISYLPWYAIFSVVGLAVLYVSAIRNWIRRTLYSMESTQSVSRVELWYGIVFALVSGWLILYYGAFTFTEYIDPTRVLLGSSYLRFWMPILIFSIPLAVRGIQWVANLWAERLRMPVVIFISLIFVGLSIPLTVADPLQGLMQLRRHIASYEQVRQSVIEYTSADAVIVAGGADRYFFPERRVIASLPVSDAEAATALAQVARQAPVYIYENALNLNVARVHELLSRNELTTEPGLTLPDQINLTRIVPDGTD